MKTRISVLALIVLIWIIAYVAVSSKKNFMGDHGHEAASQQINVIGHENGHQEQVIVKVKKGKRKTTNKH
jgi:hypothetical protein